MWSLHRAALSNGIVPVIPAVAVAEGYRTEGRGDRVSELLAGTEVEPFSGDTARRAGEIAARCDTSDLRGRGRGELAERRNYAVVSQRQPCCGGGGRVARARARPLTRCDRTGERDRTCWVCVKILIRDSIRGRLRYTLRRALRGRA